MAIDPKSKLVRLCAGLLLVVLVAGLWYWFGPSRQLAHVARVRAGTAINAVAGTLVVQAEEAQELKSEIAGRVSVLSMALDQQVARDQVLLQLDTADTLLEIERVESELAAARRRLELGSSHEMDLQNANEALAEVSRQQAKGFTSEVEVTRQRRVVQALEQRRDQELLARSLEIEGLENQLKVRRRQLEKMTLRAPFDGIIARLDTGRGDLIGAGLPIARLISVRRLVEARLSEENFAGVRVGQKARVSFLPYGTAQYDARVVKVLSTSDPETQRYVVHLEVDAEQMPLSKLIPGITGDVSIILDERPARALIPRRALMGSLVKVVEGSRVRLRKVVTGYSSLTAVEVIEGLAPGDLVIADDVDRFGEGQAVRTTPTEDSRWH